jgi:hypothetical protein
MKTSTKYSVSDAATLYKKSRATLYKDIKNGVLSRDHDGSIDFSELLRVYGEPFSGKHSKHTDTSPTQTINTPEYTDNTVIELKNQIDFLKKQLEKAEDREAKANSRIDTLLTLIEMKPTQVHPTPTSSSVQSSPSQVEPTLNVDNDKHDGLTTPEETENKRIPVPEPLNQSNRKEGFSRFFAE